MVQYSSELEIVNLIVQAEFVVGHWPSISCTVSSEEMYNI